jgi:hypothetical protein
MGRRARRRNCGSILIDGGALGLIKGVGFLLPSGTEV